LYLRHLYQQLPENYLQLELLESRYYLEHRLRRRRRRRR
jgi:hypothetical protein